MTKHDLSTIPLTMSSLEIAGLTGKRHDHVLRDARKMLAELAIPAPKFGGSYVGDNGKPVDLFNLPKRECLILVSGYSVEMRARIIDRWLMLEAALSEQAESESLSAEAKNAIGGIVKGVVHKQLAVILPAAIEAAIAADSRRAVLEYVSVRQLLDEAKALQKGRNRVNRKIGFELRMRALLSKPPVGIRKCPHSGVWLYPRDFAHAYMADVGQQLVKSHNDRVMGQGMFKLVSKKPEAEKTH